MGCYISHFQIQVGESSNFSAESTLGIKVIMDDLFTSKLLHINEDIQKRGQLIREALLKTGSQDIGPIDELIGDKEVI